MENRKESIRKLMRFLNNPEEEGGFWLPNIQRSFVWTEDQICRLFDSILRRYPISTLLVWKTKGNILHRPFIDNWDPEKYRASDHLRHEDGRKKCLVLDGQQRLQSLFLGLKGRFEDRELYLDILSGEAAAPDDVKFRFRFLAPKTAAFPWVKLKTLVFSEDFISKQAEEIQKAAGRDLTDEERRKVELHAELVRIAFVQSEAITYQELDSIEHPSLYMEEDVVEIFIRANSGGTRLGKSDLLFSLLKAGWGEADAKMEDLLDSLNHYGFSFDRDFILKTSLVLFDQGARYEVTKFRKEELKDRIEREWDEIAGAIQDVLDFVREKTFIRCDKALPSYLVLIPLIYARYHLKAGWRAARDIDKYLLRASLAGAFSGNSDAMLDAIVSRIRGQKSFDVADLFGAIRDQGRSLELSEERLWGMGYGSNTVHLLFNLWYGGFNYLPSYENNMPQVDHVFPQSLLRKVKTVNPETGRRDVLKYRENQRNQLANCMLLTRAENGPQGKTDIAPDEWFADKDASYLDMHLIPTDRSLWKLDRFEDFIEARKTLIRERFKDLLTAPRSIVAEGSEQVAS